MSHPKPWKNGDHLLICDSCGAQRYRSECDYTWDGFLMCHTRGCWYPKHPIFEVPPVVNDPAILRDVRPDQSVAQVSFVADVDEVGLITTIGNTGYVIGQSGKIIGEVDSPPNYWNS